MLEDIQRFCQEKTRSICFVYLLTFAAFGMWAFQNIVTFDAEGLYSYATIDPWYTQWIALGRWSFVLLKHLLGVYVINPFFSIAVFFLLFPLSVLAWDFLLERWSGSAGIANWATLAFCALYVVHPIWAQQFAYRNQIEVLSIVFVLAPVAVAIYDAWTSEQRPALFVGGVLLTTFVFGGYQSFIETVMLGLAIRLLFLALSSRLTKKDLVSTALYLAIPFVLYLLISALVRRFTGIAPDPYLTDQVSWSTMPLGEGLRRLFSNISARILGDGFEYTSLYAVLAVVFLIMLIALARKSEQPLATVLMGICVLLIPFALVVATVGSLVVRAHFSFVLAIAFLGAFEASLAHDFLHERGAQISQFVLPGLAVLLIVGNQLQIQSRLLYTHVTAMNEDYANMEEIYFRSQALGAKRGNAICLVGSQGNVNIDAMLSHEVIGFTYTEVTTLTGSDKFAAAMAAYGFPVTLPTEEQQKQANEAAQDMTVWPEEGSIRVYDGYFVVKLS